MWFKNSPDLFLSTHTHINSCLFFFLLTALQLPLPAFPSLIQDKMC